MHAVRSDPPTPRARSAACAAQRREQKWAACAKERKIRQRERPKQYDEEYRLLEQQGLSPPLAPSNLSSEEEEESDRGGATPERWHPPPPSPRAAEAAAELVSALGAQVSTVGSSVEAPAGAAEAPAVATEAPPTLKEEEAGFLQLEVSRTSPLRP
jgi:hypothetical protein